MVSTLVRKSLTDLSRRRARTVFAVCTLAVAVASISFFAVPTLIDRAMQEEARAGRLADVTLTMRPLVLTGDDLAALNALPNVAGVEPRSRVETRVLVGERRAPAVVVGVRDFGRQSLDLVRLESGLAPKAGEALVDVQNTNVGVYDGGAGDVLTIPGARGDRAASASVRIPISGVGRNLPAGEEVQDENVIVLYATTDTVAALSGERGYSRLALRLADASPAAAARTVEDVRGYLRTVAGFTGLTDLPEVRAPGDWPGKGETEKFAQLLSVITLLALLSALVLVSNTMTTLVAEQTREIGIMRAIGARPRQVALVYVTTALLLGALAAVVGVALGVALSSALASYFGSMFWAVDVAVGVDGTVVVVGLLVGLLAPPLAALPAIRRGMRVDLREALEATGSVVGGQDATDRLLRSLRFLPRTTQIGLRNVGRRKRRSVATTLVIALAVANLLAVLGIAAAATQTSRTSWAGHLEDAQISTGGQAFFDQRANDVISATPGVAEAQPVLKNTVQLAGREAFVWGVSHEPLIRYRSAGGRWFTAAEEQEREPVAVIERNIAELADVGVGDQVSISTAAGPVELRIVGLAKNQQEDGTVLYIPLATARQLLDQPSGISTYWVRMTSSEHGFVDRTMSRLEDRLAGLGFEVTSEIAYVAERDEIAANRSITTAITVLGFLIIAMSMVGLANAITMGVIERTREIGILRSIGARARHIHRIFGAEGMLLALAGWLVGVPLGYALERLLVWFIWEVVEVRMPVVFPPWNVLIALTGTVVLALVVMALPLRRAARLRPGDAIRYAA